MGARKVIPLICRSEVGSVSWISTILILFFSSILVTFYLLFGITTSKCLIADDVKLIGSNTTRDTEFFLYEIVSGTADKLKFLALYNQVVEFDECGEPDIPAIYSTFVEYGLEKGLQEQWIKQVVVSNGRFDIEYSTLQIDKWSVQWLDN